MRRPWTILILLALLVAAAAAQQPRYANLKFVVLKEDNGKPVRNASVILHALNKQGKQAKGGMQLKTDGEGKTDFAGIPFGKLRIQVIAGGFQTYGGDHDINQPEQEFVIKLKRPKEQLSIYK